MFSRNGTILPRRTCAEVKQTALCVVALCTRRNANIFTGAKVGQEDPKALCVKRFRAFVLLTSTNQAIVVALDRND